MSVSGSALVPKNVPEFLFNSMRGVNKTAPPGGDLSHLNEEVFAQDGQVEELIAYNAAEV